MNFWSSRSDRDEEVSAHACFSHSSTPSSSSLVSWATCARVASSRNTPACAQSPTDTSSVWPSPTSSSSSSVSPFTSGISLHSCTSLAFQLTAISHCVLHFSPAIAYNLTTHLICVKRRPQQSLSDKVSNIYARSRHGWRTGKQKSYNSIGWWRFGFCCVKNDGAIPHSMALYFSSKINLLLHHGFT